MSQTYALIIQFVLPLTTFYRSGAQRSNVYKRDVSVTSWRFHNRAWQPQRHDRLPETSRTLLIHRVALTNQRCSLATECGIKNEMTRVKAFKAFWYQMKIAWLEYSLLGEMWQHPKSAEQILLSIDVVLGNEMEESDQFCKFVVE